MKWIDEQIEYWEKECNKPWKDDSTLGIITPMVHLLHLYKLKVNLLIENNKIN